MPLPTIPYMKPSAGVQINPLHPLSRGLVGCWLFNEGAGSRASDISGHGNHGTLTNMSPNAQNSGWGGSPFGGGLHFDATDDYIDCGNALDLSSSFTISIWSKLKSLTTYCCLLSKKPNSIVWWQLVVNSNGTYNFQFDDDVTKVSLYSDVEMDDDQWHHAVVTRDSSGYTLYVDNVVNDTAVNNGSLVNSGNFEIGAEVSGDLYTKGAIDHVSIYDRALSAAEVKQLYHDPFCNLLRVPVRYVPAAAGGLPIPVAMNYYRRRRVT